MRNKIIVLFVLLLFTFTPAQAKPAACVHVYKLNGVTQYFRNTNQPIYLPGCGHVMRRPQQLHWFKNGLSR
jgi:hypothetical protein